MIGGIEEIIREILCRASFGGAIAVPLTEIYERFNELVARGDALCTYWILPAGFERGDGDEVRKFVPAVCRAVVYELRRLEAEGLIKYLGRGWIAILDPARLCGEA